MARHTQSEVAANVPRPSHPGLPLQGATGPNGIRQDAQPGAEAWHNRLLLKDF